MKLDFIRLRNIDFLDNDRTEWIDGVEGSLVDNVLAICDGVLFACYEEFETTNSSIYYIEYSNNANEQKAIYNNWYRFNTRSEKEQYNDCYALYSVCDGKGKEVF